ncbi:MAG: ATP-binding protein, partial [Candidatus Marinimicrobia bacterium]|nr:ATP-binding protein [Candidatus Neomarinimicrobiota bacterium]
LARREVSTGKLAGVPPILDEAGITQLPQANVAVLDGIKFSPSQPIDHDGLVINTLWGELAWQLLGKAGYDKVSWADKDGTSPGKKVLVDLLSEASPCVVLIDELVAFIRQFEPGKQYKAGTFDSNMSFIQALTESMKLVPDAILLASLPESDLEVGGNMGQRALNSLEKYFARVESVWKPVATEEAFEIVRRRLFDSVGDSGELNKVCKSFADFYRDHSEKFPPETQSSHYQERLHQSYPIHPEIFDRLYEDWSTLDKFQRTRGVLQYMAIVIHRLWNSDNRDALIMPGSIPMDDSNVRNKSIHYLPQGWEPVIAKEIDGTRSEPFDIDGHDTRFGSVQAARRTARTIFLGSAPSTGEQMIRGIKEDHILLGTLQPGQTVGVFEDVLHRLRDRLQHLYSGQDRFWFDTKPNLRREMESRKQNISDNDDVQPLLKTRVTRIFGRNHSFAGIHVFTPSVDVPDDWGSGPRLVVLPPKSSYSRTGDNTAVRSAEEILRKRGEQSRQKQNRLIFLAPDYDVIGRLSDQARTYLAWNSILDDFQSNRLVYQSNQLAEVKRAVDGAEQTLQQLIREAYKWLICPVEEFVNGKPTLQWETVTVSPASQNLVQEIDNKLREEEWLISEWSPIHLRNLLNQWYFKEGVTDVSALKVYQDCCNYLYLPRLLNDQVLRSAINTGVETEDFFGFASGKEEGKYLGFVYGRNTLVTLDESALLIEYDTAAAFKKVIEKPKAPEVEEEPKDYGGENNGGDSVSPPGLSPVSEKKSVVKRFHASVNLDPDSAALDFSNISEEVLQHFTSKMEMKVKISVEIEVETKGEMDENLQRTVKENASTLKFTHAEFEKE